MHVMPSIQVTHAPGRLVLCRYRRRGQACSAALRHPRAPRTAARDTAQRPDAPRELAGRHAGQGREGGLQQRGARGGVQHQLGAEEGGARGKGGEGVRGGGVCGWAEGAGRSRGRRGSAWCIIHIYIHHTYVYIIIITYIHIYHIYHIYTHISQHTRRDPSGFKRPTHGLPSAAHLQRGQRQQHRAQLAAGHAPQRCPQRARVRLHPFGRRPGAGQGGGAGDV
jgi:hypothetical protein